jgi:hypothetical protein
MKKFLQKIKESVSNIRKDKAKCNLVFVVIFIAFYFFLLCTFVSKYDELNKEYKYTLYEYEQQLFKEKEQNLYTFIGEYSFLKNEKIPTNDSVVYEFIKATGCWYPDIVMAQYVIESNHGKSMLSQEYNNCFGMKYVGNKGRRNTQLPDVKGYGDYGVYINWQLSVVDRQLWDHRVFEASKPTKDYYLNILGKIYAEDINYISKITKEAEKWNY